MDSKYTTMPDNSYFERRMANGEKLLDIFDRIDYWSRCGSEDKKRPITVRVGSLYNFVSNNYILFDNWFTYADDFEEFTDWTFAYRRLDSQRIRVGGVLIKRDGGYITREEFYEIYSGEKKYENYVVVKQYDGLYNFVDVNNGAKVEKTGLDVDYVDHHHRSMTFYRVGKGGNLSRAEMNDMWSSCNPKHNNIKYNIYNINKGIISPNLWFDFIEPFQFAERYGFHKREREICNFTIVYLNGKKNFINQEGILLSKDWFDDCRIYGDGTGEACILKSPNLKDLPDGVGEYGVDYNPEKFNIYTVDFYGRIKSI